MEASAHLAHRKQPKTEAGRQEECPDEQKGRAVDRAVEKEAQPAEAEYLSSRCVIFTYFQGDIGDVVDEHFSRALSQPSQSRGSPKGLFRGERRPFYTLILRLVG